MTALIYKHRTNLIYSGLAVMAFGLWGIVRVLALFYLEKSRLIEVAEISILENNVDISVETILTISMLLVFSAFLIDLAFRLFVGLSAIQEGRGRNKRITYLVFSILYLVFTVCVDILIGISLERDFFSVSHIIVVIIDITSCIAYIVIIRSSLTIRHLERSIIAERRDGHAA